MVVSSVVSAAPNPTVAAYAASKSYLTRCGGGNARRLPLFSLPLAVPEFSGDFPEIFVLFVELLVS